MELGEASALARRLLDEHDLRDWSFRFDRSRRRFGACHYSQRCISLSRVLTSLNEPKTVTGVVLHEVAHALAGHRAGHGLRWRRIAAGLGIAPKALLDAKDIAAPRPKYTGTCPHCAATIERHRRDRVACTPCCEADGGRFSTKYLLVWTPSSTSRQEAA